MKKIGIVLALSMQVVVASANAMVDMSKMNCQLSVVKHNGDVDVKSQGPVVVNQLTKNISYRSADSNVGSAPDYFAKMSITSGKDKSGVDKQYVNVELYDSAGASVSFFTGINEPHIIAYTQSQGAYNVVGSKENARLYFECQ